MSSGFDIAGKALSGNFIGAGADLFKTVGFGGLFGGSSCSGSQKTQRGKIAKAINDNTTYAERKSFIDRMGMENPPQPTGTDMAFFFMGGKDCKHKNVTPGDQRFLDNLESWLNQKMQANARIPEDPYQSNSDFSANQNNGIPAAAIKKAAGNGSGIKNYVLPGLIFLALGGFFFLRPGGKNG